MESLSVTVTISNKEQTFFLHWAGDQITSQDIAGRATSNYKQSVSKYSPLLCNDQKAAKFTKT